MTDADQITVLIQRWASGDASALGDAIPLVYSDLRRSALRLLRNERSRNTLQCTALVNELYLRLVAQQGLSIVNRAHFLTIAARLMRQILVDYARQKHTYKRGGGATLVPLSDLVADASARELVDLIALDSALREFADVDQRKSQIVDLRYFAGLSIEEIAEAVDLSPATVKREWTVARLWLSRRIRGSARGA